MACHFFAVEFSGVSTVCLAHIVVDRYSRGYNVYSKAIGQMPAARIQGVLDGQKIFVVEFSGVGTIWLAHIIVETDSKEYNVYFRALRDMPAAPGQMVVCVLV